MSLPPVSVVVVSHGRPALLRRALIGIGQMFYRPFEVIVVADPDGLDHIRDLAFDDRLKTAIQEVPNISAARNAGIALAAGEIVAFIDDDAVPEPTWLAALCAPFADPGIAAAGGHVIGRNGISLQWGTQTVDRFGQSHPLNLPAGDTACPDLPEGHALKLEGTNMAIRREVLVALGGFDPAFHFYLDDTDLSLRLLQGGYRAASVPRALVHHGFAPSRRRHGSRAPRSLHDIGASSAVFLRKHADADQIGPQLDALTRVQRARLSRFLLAGDLEPRDQRRLMADLRDGIAEGRERPLTGAAGFGQDMPAIRPLLDGPAPGPQRLAGRWFQRRALMAKAEAHAARGISTSLFLFSPTARPHTVRFSRSGVWVQSGGLFGRSARAGPHVVLQGFRTRLRNETLRVRDVRGIED